MYVALCNFKGVKEKTYKKGEKILPAHTELALGWLKEGLVERIVDAPSPAASAEPSVPMKEVAKEVPKKKGV